MAAKRVNPFTSAVGLQTNAFAPATQSPAPHPFAQKTAYAQPNAVNPFASAVPSTAAGQQPAPNPFGEKTTTSSQLQFGQGPNAQSKQAKSPFLKDDAASKPPKSASTKSEYVQPAWPKRREAPVTQFNGNAQQKGKRLDDHGSQKPVKASCLGPSSNSGKNQSPAIARYSTSNGVLNKSSLPSNAIGTIEFAQKIEDQLAEDGLNPPKWPSNPGSRSQTQVMGKFREDYKSYREKARQSLIRAQLIDDPDVAKKLSDAIPFKGICKDMCPEWEKITRITEHDVKSAEKEDRNGEQVARPDIMVKRLSRSAAGQEAPLPMDVRSPAALRNSLDYLIDELISSDDRLPSQHNFLWDRTRAIRRDFTFQAPAMTPEEFPDYVYCLETIARFHVTSLHLLSQPGFAAEDFSEQQEIEQLGNTLLSLIQTYDDCAKDDIKCDNEAEFRGYYALFRAQDPSLKERIQGWNPKFWSSDDVRTAMCLVESIENSSRPHGPLIPHASTELALDAAAIFFSIVDSPQISYTMACFAEIHFNRVRRSILQIIKKAYSRPRDGPKDLTPAFLQKYLRFDTEEEAVIYVEKHGLNFEEDLGSKYLIISARQQLDEPRIAHAFSHDIVERKRRMKTLPEVIHGSAFNKTCNDEGSDETPEESMFVADSPDPSISSMPKTTPIFAAPALGNPSASQPSTTTTSHQSGGLVIAPGTSSFATPTPTSLQAPSVNPFGNLSGSSTPSFSPLKPQDKGQSTGHPVIASGTGASTQTSEKRVTFGENTYRFIEPNSTTSSETPSPFSFLNKDNGKAADPSAPKEPILFPPPQSATSTTTNKDRPPTSVLSDRSSTAGSGLKFPTFGTTAPTPAQPVGGVSAQSVSDKPILPTSSESGKSTENNGLSLVFPSKPSVPNPANQPLPPVTANDQTTFQAAAQPTNPAPETKPCRDPAWDFTRWFVCGDQGLLEEYEEKLIQHILKDTWEKYQETEETRKRKEEDEKSWTEARAFRTKSLQITYFYRWLNGFRKRSVVRRIKMEREKARQWNLPENVAKRKAAEKAAKEQSDREVMDLLRKSTKGTKENKRRRESVRSQQSIEEALHPTGVFNGFPNEREAARQAARDDKDDAVAEIPHGQQTLLRIENHRRKKHGLQPLKRLPESPQYKEGSKSAKMRALATGADSASLSNSSFRNSIFSSSYRSSLGFNNSRVAKPRKGRVSDSYWRMKAQGFVQMPTGDYLHESVALPMLQQGQRYSGIGDLGLGTASVTPSQSPPSRGDLFDCSPPAVFEHPARSRVSSSPSVASSRAVKRKRAQAEPDMPPDDEDLAAYRREASASIRKRPRSGDLMDNDQDFLSQIGSLLQDVAKEGKN